MVEEVGGICNIKKTNLLCSDDIGNECPHISRFVFLLLNRLMNN